MRWGATLALELHAVSEPEESFVPKSNGAGTTAARLASVEGRVATLEGHADLLKTLVERLGHNPDDGQPATGIYKVLGDLSFQITDVKARLGWFEKLRERAIGAGWALIGLVPIVGAVVWFLAGAKITKLFGG